MRKVLIAILFLSSWFYCSAQIRVKSNTFVSKLHSPGNGTYAITIGHTIYLNCDANEFFIDTPWMIHEFNHVRQWERFGTMGFISRYIFFSILKGYKKNPFELQLKQKYK